MNYQLYGNARRGRRHARGVPEALSIRDSAGTGEFAGKRFRPRLLARQFGQLLRNGCVSCAVRGLLRPTAGFLLLCLIALAPTAPASAQEQEAVGQVIQQRGVVTALRATAARPLHLGASVFRGDRIITAAEAKVEIEFRDGSTLAVGSGTTVDIVNFSPDAREEGGLLLLIGIIRTGLSALWSGGFEVRTRAAVASARSTEWITEAREDRSSVFVISGEVAVTGVAEGTTVQLSEGEGTDVDIGEAPSPPTQWGDARVQDVLARTRVP